MKPNDIKYLRVSLLSNCNFHCNYCRPPNTPDEAREPLTKPAKFKYAITALHHLGVRKVRFTGGEPTLYRHLPDLITHTRKLSPDVTTAVTTNGSLLARMAPVLAQAGLHSLNISLDTLSTARFRQLAGHDGLDQVLTGIDTARQFIPSVKLNCVIMRGVNDQETNQLIEYADGRRIDIRFIEFMPARHGNGRDQRYISGQELRRALPFELTPISSNAAAAARYYTAPHLHMRVGFIEAVSRPFCDSCNRIRLTANGALYGCLFSGTNFNIFDGLDDDPAHLAGQIERLIAARTGMGCTDAMTGHGYKPSFIVTGG